METMYITETEIKRLIQKYIFLYLNPRSMWEDFTHSAWRLNGGDIYDCSSLHRFYEKQTISISLQLSFKKNYLEVYEIEDIFFKTLLSSNERLSDGFCKIISTFLMMFYFPYYVFANPHSLVHQKAISFFQLSNRHISSPYNDAIRFKYIKNLLRNSHLSDEIELLDFNDGVLSFEGKPLKESCLDLLKIDNSKVFYHIVFYFLSIVEFMEKGFEESSEIFLLNDIYSQVASYTYFLNIENKPYKFRNLIMLLNNIYSFPKTTTNDFINKNFLLNFMLFDKSIKFHIGKYINSEEIKKEIIEDVRYIEDTYLKNRIFNNEL